MGWLGVSIITSTNSHIVPFESHLLTKLGHFELFWHTNFFSKENSFLFSKSGGVQSIWVPPTSKSGGYSTPQPPHDWRPWICMCIYIYKSKYTDLYLSGQSLSYVAVIKYLGISIESRLKFRCSYANVIMKFYRSFNSLYSKC